MTNAANLENTRSRGHAWRAYLNDVRLPGCVEAVLAEAGAGREGSDDR